MMTDKSLATVFFACGLFLIASAVAFLYFLEPCICVEICQPARDFQGGMQGVYEWH